MTKRQRKSLGDALAEDFVYGESKPTDESPEEEQIESEAEATTVESQPNNILPTPTKPDNGT